MSEYQSNVSLEEAAARLMDAETFVLTTHAKPDGDAIGSVIALSEALESLGKKVQRWVMPPLPAPLKILSEGLKLHYYADQTNPLPEGEPQRIVVLDTGSWAQLKPLKPWLETRTDRTLVIDHHLHGNDVGRWIYTDPTSAATAQIVERLIRLIGAEPTPRALEALYVGVASDTGWFRFSNTTAATHRLAADLIDAGVDHARLYTATEQAERTQKLALMQRALASVQYLGGGQAAVLHLKATDFSETGARQEETERFVDLPQLVKSVRAVAMVIESKPGRLVRISFRSKPGPDAIDVNRIAQGFGGGGHARAAGAKAEESLDQVLEKVAAALTEAVSGPAA